MQLQYKDIDKLINEIENHSKDIYCNKMAIIDFQDYTRFDKYIKAKLEEKKITNAQIDYNSMGIAIKFKR